MNFESETHSASIGSDGLLRVFPKEDPVLRQTQYSPDGTVETTLIDKNNASAADRKLLSAMARMPLFAATYKGSREWWCDIDAGMQRWKGTKSGSSVGKGLQACGFGKKAVTSIMRRCRKHLWGYCPRQG